MMSLKRNIASNYISQFYVTVIGIVMVPQYLKYMGAEAYGLVGFFAMLQAWFNLLDLGLTPTMARETARFSAGAADALSYRRLVRALEAIFILVALTGGVAIFAAAGVIAREWLNVQTLALSQVEFAVKAMGLCIALRWMAGLYRGAISGSERLVWLGGYNVVIATLRFVGVLVVFILFGTSPTVFFTYQLLVAVLELGCLVAKAYGLLPAMVPGQRLGWSFAPVKPLLKFSLTIAFTSSVWVLLTQTDKLVLSKLLPLTQYGYFTLAVLVASIVGITTGPISAALIPRMARLEAQGDRASLQKLYRDATQLVCLIALPIAFTLATFAERVVWAWTGDSVAAKVAAPILQLYAVGNGVLAIAAFPYYLQFARGDLRLHLIGNVIFVALLIPSLVYATWRFGGTGAGWAWLVSNMVTFFIWIPFVHGRLERGLHRQWLGKDILPIAAAASIGAWLTSLPSFDRANRLEAIAVPLLMGVIVLTLASLASSTFRTQAYMLLNPIGVVKH